MSEKINGMIRSPNDGVHLETPQAQTMRSLAGTRAPPARHPGHQQASGEAFPACIRIMHGRRIYSRGLQLY